MQISKTVVSQMSTWGRRQIRVKLPNIQALWSPWLILITGQGYRGSEFFWETHLNNIKIYLMFAIEIRKIGHFIPVNSVLREVTQRKSQIEGIAVSESHQT